MIQTQPCCFSATDNMPDGGFCTVLPFGPVEALAFRVTQPLSLSLSLTVERPDGTLPISGASPTVFTAWACLLRRAPGEHGGGHFRVVQATGEANGADRGIRMVNDPQEQRHVGEGPL